MLILIAMMLRRKLALVFAFALSCFPAALVVDGAPVSLADDARDAGSDTRDDDLMGSKPHIIVLLADNLGWANVEWHRPPNLPAQDLYTPSLDALRKEGVELDRHYTYKFCSPSRSSFLTGRLPFHVNIYNDDPTMPGQGVPRNMTMISSKLKSAGYSNHFIGKWHVGMSSRSMSTPLARDFDTSIGYFHSTNNYYDSTRAEGCNNSAAVDLWDGAGPALLNGTAYEERIFGKRAVDIIANHDTSTPLFMYYAFHTSCVGWASSGDVLQPDKVYYEKFAHIDDADRRANVAMVALMDDIVGNLTRALKENGMWTNTLLLWSSDNGGAVHLGGGASSWPLRGGYYNNWEGGIRVSALLSGGILPSNVIGTKLSGFIHECDWFSTFCYLAGVDARENPSKALPPIDSLNVWPLIVGRNTTSPRVEWPLTPFGEEAGTRAPHGGDAAYIAEGRYKLLIGNIRQAGWTGQIHPNSTAPWDSFNDVLDCTARTEKLGCLFDIIDDPGEHRDLALSMPQKAQEIYSKMKAAELQWVCCSQNSFFFLHIYHR